jgi:hypothetical protein
MKGGKCHGNNHNALCPACNACPEVVISWEGVRIGQADNMVRLSHAEWNHLVELVRVSRMTGKANTLPMAHKTFLILIEMRIK